MARTSLRTLNDTWFNGNNNIEYFDFSTNELTEITVTNIGTLKRIKTANFSDNDIRVIQKNAFEGAIRLEVLDFHNNRIRHIVPLGELPRLRYLDLGKNSISEVSYI